MILQNEDIIKMKGQITQWAGAQKPMHSWEQTKTG